MSVSTACDSGRVIHIAIIANRSCHLAQKRADILILPRLGGINWDALERAPDLIKAGEEAMAHQLEECEKWFEHPRDGILSRLVRYLPGRKE